MYSRTLRPSASVAAHESLLTVCAGAPAAEDEEGAESEEAAEGGGDALPASRAIEPAAPQDAPPAPVPSRPATPPAAVPAPQPAAARNAR